MFQLTNDVQVVTIELWVSKATAMVVWSDVCPGIHRNRIPSALVFPTAFLCAGTIMEDAVLYQKNCISIRQFSVMEGQIGIQRKSISHERLMNLLRCHDRL